MDIKKIQVLQSNGFTVGTVEEFLELTPDEVSAIDKKIDAPTLSSLDIYVGRVRGFMNKDLGRQDSLANYALGLSGECGEVVDLIKKHLYHKKGLDKADIIKELGDVCWYLIALTETLGIDLEEVMQENILKLQNRHGGNKIDWDKEKVNKPLEQT